MSGFTRVHRGWFLPGRAPGHAPGQAAGRAPGQRARRSGWPALLLVLTAGGCREDAGVPIDPADENARLGAELAFCSDTPQVDIQVVASGLEVPWGMAASPDGRIFVTERPGRIRVIDSGILVPEPWAVLDVYQDSEAGLLGIALSPTFATDGHVFVAATSFRNGPGFPDRLVGMVRRRVENALGVREGGTSVILQVIRFTERDGRGIDPTVIVDGIAAHQLHAGAALRFGPDGNLYLTMGDGALPHTAADPLDRRGTVLRYTPDGGIPADNPRPGEPVYAYGFRDIQGMAWHPLDGALYAVDHGPTSLEVEGFRSDRDELNRVVPGGDHGWPRVSGRVRLEGTVTPLVEWTPAVAPSGLDILLDPASPYHGDVFVGTLRGRSLQRVVLRPGEDGTLVPTCRETLLGEEFGRLRGVLWAGDQGLLVSTSNRDRRGVPAEDDDRILRVNLTAP